MREIQSVEVELQLTLIIDIVMTKMAIHLSYENIVGGIAMSSILAMIMGGESASWAR
ncbi:hypothetical protein [Methanosarcina siciliae]|uniref:hypothetical protein n=1 Tax=Methanosarcina siciliae TaxID=38027 RepID=UPI000AC5E45C|nr:hypothetical protein [Methanosarcina siciliae]